MRRELKEETGVSALLKCVGEFSYHAPPKNEIVAVFSCESNDHIRIDRSESFQASFYTRDEVNVIAASEEQRLGLEGDGRYSHSTDPQ